MRQHRQRLPLDQASMSDNIYQYRVDLINRVAADYATCFAERATSVAAGDDADEPISPASVGVTPPLFSDY